MPVSTDLTQVIIIISMLDVEGELEEREVEEMRGGERKKRGGEMKKRGKNKRGGGGREEDGGGERKRWGFK